MTDEEEDALDEQPTVCDGHCESCEFLPNSIECLAHKEELMLDADS
jgi:hypothetical protein